MHIKLVVVEGDAKTAEVKLRLPAVIGRGRGSTLQIPQALVSRQHCEAIEANGRLRVRDLGSLNGTFVDGVKVREADVMPGQTLTVGSVTFRVEYDLSENAALDPPVFLPAPPSPASSSDLRLGKALKEAPAAGDAPSDFRPSDSSRVIGDAPERIPTGQETSVGGATQAAHAPLGDDASTPDLLSGGLGVDSSNESTKTIKRPPSHALPPLANSSSAPPSQASPPSATPPKSTSDDDDDLRSFLQSLGK